MKYLGDFAEDYATLNFKFSTHKADGTPITLAGTPAVSVYKANGTTQSTAGVTLTVDFDSVTGLHNVLIDLSADAFYATGDDYDVVITTGTVDSVSVVGTVLAHFSIENRFIEADMVKVAGSAVDASVAQLGVNVVNWKGSAAPAMTGDAYARLGAPTGASVSADVAAVKAETSDIHGHASTIDGHITADYGATEKAAIDLLDDAAGGLADIHTDVGTVLTNLATVDGVVDDILTDTGTTLPATLSTIEGKIDTVDGNVDSILTDTGTTIPGTLTTIAGYIDTEIGTLATELAKVPKSDGEVTFNDTCVGDIKSGLATSVMLPANFVDLSITDTTGLVSVADKTGFSLTTAPPTTAEIKTAMEAAGGHLALILEDTGTTLDGKVDTIDGIVDAIKLQTDKLGFDANSYVNALVKAQDNIDFGALQKASLNAATPAATVSDKTGFSLSAAGIDSILDEVVEGTLTMRQVIMLCLSVLAGKSAGGGTATITFRDNADSKDRITATVDANGNRTAVVVDAS